MLLACVLRLVVSFQLLDNYVEVAQPSPDSDMWDYRRKAQEVLTGEYNYSKGFFKQPFYYMCFLPLVFKLLGSSAEALIVAQTFLAGASVFFCGLSFAHIFGKRVGLIAALLLALCRYHIFYTPFALIAVLQSFWMILLLYLSILLYKNPSIKNVLICGGVLAMSNLTRGNVVLLLPLVALLIYTSHKGNKKYFFKSLLILMLPFVLLHLPFMWVNYKAYGQWRGTATNAVDVFAVGSTPESSPASAEPYSGESFMKFSDSYSYLKWVKEANLPGEAQVPVSENVLAWAKQEPFAFLELKFRMFLLYWSHLEIPNNVALSKEVEGKKIKVASSWLHFPLLFDFGLLGSLAVAGLMLSWRKRKNKKVCCAALFVVIYALSIVLSYVLARFRLPMLPLVCGFSAYALHLLWQSLKFKRFPVGIRTLSFCFIFFVSFAFVCFGFETYRSSFEAPISSWARPHGVQFSDSDKKVIKDNGPRILGGWWPYEVQEKSVQKIMLSTFDHAADHNVTLRFQLMHRAEGVRTKVTLSSNFSAPVHHELDVKKGLHWYEIKLPEFIKNTAGRYEYQLTFLEAKDNSIYLLYDKQRDYGRSLVAGGAVPGEWVAELIFRP